MSTKPVPKPRRRLARPWIVYPALLLGLALGLILYPPSFRALFRLALEHEARQRNGELTIKRIEGSVFAPIELIHAHFRHDTAGGARTDLQLDRVILRFALRGLITREHSFFASLDVDGGKLKMDFQRPEDRDVPEPQRDSRNFIPDRISVRDLDIVVTAGESSLQVTNLQFGTEVSAMGPFQAQAVRFRSPGFEKTLPRVFGRTDLRDDWLSIVSLRLDDQVVVENASMQVENLLSGRLDTYFEISAFKGSVRGQVSSRFDRRRTDLDASGYFYKLDVPSLARFVGSKNQTNGTVQEGKFSFSGNPLRPDRSTGSMRFQAGDFQWGERRWDNLVAAATLVARRLEVTEFKLEQAGNTLEAKGEVKLGKSAGSWIESDFRMDLNAKIADLGALSALLGPSAALWQGQLTAQGSVRGQDKNFDGQIIVEGAGLHYGKTPVGEFHGALRLNGNDLELTDFSLVRGEDYARGRGGIKILGARHYWGEIKLESGDLAAYREFPAPRNFPWPLQGSAKGQWSGDGSSKAHSGAIDLHLHDLAKPGPEAQPLDLDITATYSPDNIYVTRGRIGHGDLFLTTEVNATPERTQFRKVEMKSGGRTRASGSLSVPLGFARLRAGADPGLPAGEVEADLTFDQFRISEAWRLLGRKPLTRGQITGRLTAHGALNAFSAEGQLKLTDGKITESALGLSVEDIAAEATLAGDQMRLPQFSGNALGGRVSGAGEINLRNLLDPNVRVGLSGRDARVAQGDFKASGDFDVRVTGLLSQAYVDGEVKLTQASMSQPGSILPLLQRGDQSAAASPFILSLIPALQRRPFSAWQYDLAVSSAQQLSIAPDTRITPVLQVQGRSPSLQVGGRVDFETRGALAPGEPVTKYSGSLYLLDEPVVAARAVEKEQEWLLIGHSKNPDRVKVAGKNEPGAKVWPGKKNVLPETTLESAFELNLSPSIPVHER